MPVDPTFHLVALNATNPGIRMDDASRLQRHLPVADDGVSAVKLPTSPSSHPQAAMLVSESLNFLPRLGIETKNRVERLFQARTHELGALPFKQPLSPPAAGTLADIQADFWREALNAGQQVIQHSGGRANALIDLHRALAEASLVWESEILQHLAWPWTGSWVSWRRTDGTFAGVGAFPPKIWPGVHPHPGMFELDRWVVEIPSYAHVAEKVLPPLPREQAYPLLFAVFHQVASLTRSLQVTAHPSFAAEHLRRQKVMIEEQATAFEHVAARTWKACKDLQNANRYWSDGQVRKAMAEAERSNLFAPGVLQRHIVLSPTSQQWANAGLGIQQEPKIPPCFVCADLQAR